EEAAVGRAVLPRRLRGRAAVGVGGRAEPELLRRADEEGKVRTREHRAGDRVVVHVERRATRARDRGDRVRAGRHPADEREHRRTVASLVARRGRLAVELEVDVRVVPDAVHADERVDAGDHVRPAGRVGQPDVPGRRGTRRSGRVLAAAAARRRGEDESGEEREGAAVWAVEAHCGMLSRPGREVPASRFRAARCRRTLALVTDLLELQERAAGEFGKRVDAVRDDQWSAPTPCNEWNVRALVNHIVYEDRWAPHLVRGETIEQVGTRYD